MCGSDDVTYKSSCFLRRVTCLEQRNVTEVAAMPCRERQAALIDSDSKL